MTSPSCIFLREKLQNYLRIKGESVRWLSKRARVDYQKLYRLEAGDAKGFGFFDAKRLVKFMDPEGHRAFLKEFYPGEMEDVSDLNVAEEDLDTIFETVEFLLSNPIYYNFYLFTVQTPGLDRTGLEKRYGEFGLDLLVSMIQKGAIWETEGQFSGILESDLKEPSGILRQLCKIHFDLIDLDDQPGGFAAHGARGLSLEGQQEAYQVVLEAWHKLRAIFNDPTRRGDRMSLFTLGFGSMMRECP